MFNLSQQNTRAHTDSPKKSRKITHSLFVTLFALIAVTGAVNAHNSVRIHNDDNIIIEHLHNKQETRYQVNGKTFTWSDLTKEQQATLRPIEEKLKLLEDSIIINTDAFEQAVITLEEKAREMELEVRKLEEVTLEIEKNTVNLDDIARWSQALSEKIDHSLLDEKAKEMAALEQLVPEIDEEKLKELEDYTQEYETLIIEISKSISK